MKLAFHSTVCVLIIGSIAGLGTRAGAAPQTRPAASGQATVSGDLLKDWQDQKKALMDIAEAMPEDKFSYKTTPAQRNYGEQVMHVALVNVGILKLIGGKTAPPSFTPQSAKTKAERIKEM